MYDTVRKLVDPECVFSDFEVIPKIHFSEDQYPSVSEALQFGSRINFGKTKNKLEDRLNCVKLYFL